jgi:hypothetical protein
VTWLLRVVLPDRPGSLGAVATALGEAGADILSLDVVERGPGGAVDDLVVALPPGGLADRLVSSAQSVPGVVVESLRPYHGAPDLHRDLELVEALAAAPERALDLLVEHCPGVFRCGWAALVEHALAGPVVASRTPGAPDLVAAALPWLPLARARRLGEREDRVPEPWQALGTELVAAPVGAPTRAVLLGRPGGPRFRSSEVLRLAHLAGIAATVTGRAARAEPQSDGRVVQGP